MTDTMIDDDGSGIDESSGPNTMSYESINNPNPTPLYSSEGVSHYSMYFITVIAIISRYSNLSVCIHQEIH